MSTLLLVSGGLVWWFVGLVASQLIWRELPSGAGTIKTELYPLLFLVFGIFSLFGPVLGYFYMSRATANKIEEKRARKQVRDAMRDEKNQLILKYHGRLLKEEKMNNYGERQDKEKFMKALQAIFMQLLIQKTPAH